MTTPSESGQPSPDLESLVREVALSVKALNPPEASLFERVLKTIEPCAALAAVIMAIIGLLLSTKALEEQTSEAWRQRNVSNSEWIFKYLEVIYEHETCTTDACSLDSEMLGRCARECPPSHQLRLRLAATQGLLNLSTDPEVVGSRLLSLYGFDVVLAHARIPWFNPVGGFGSVLFSSADLRCSSWMNSHFTKVSMAHADLRGALGLAGMTVTDWTGALCPDGIHWVDGTFVTTCATSERLTPMTRDNRCAGEHRSPPVRNSDGTLKPETSPPLQAGPAGADAGK
jgi:hypothetical protein